MIILLGTIRGRQGNYQSQWYVKKQISSEIELGSKKRSMKTINIILLCISWSFELDIPCHEQRLGGAQALRTQIYARETQILPQPRPLHFPISFFSNIHTVLPFVAPFCPPMKSAKTSSRCCAAKSFNASRVICESRKKSSSRIDTSQWRDQRDSLQREVLSRTGQILDGISRLQQCSSWVMNQQIRNRIQTQVSKSWPKMARTSHRSRFAQLKIITKLIKSNRFGTRQMDSP